ncbi:MAG: aminopeptidase P N-terminal domain-containing protein [Gemmatimonadota bacterium]
MRHLIAVLALTCCSGLHPLQAQITPASYMARRAEAAKRMDDGVLVGFGGRAPIGTSAFQQLPAFEYLTGFNEPDAAFALVKRDGAVTSFLFTQEESPISELFNGFVADSASIAARTGLPTRPIAELRPLLDSLSSAGLTVYDLRDFASSDASQSDSLTRGSSLITSLRAAHLALVVKDGHELLDQLRAKKSPEELALMRRAIEITAEAQRTAMRVTTPGVNEGEIQGVIESVFRENGAGGPSFTTIVGSGPNSTTLHYEANSRTTMAGDVMVMDIGASYQGYSADVTRTIPVSGTYTPEQRTIFQLVRDAQAAAERQVHPGASVKTETDSMEAVRDAGLVRLGLIESTQATFDPPWAKYCANSPVACQQGFLFMPHGLGHGIGLEVHDPAQYYYDDHVFKIGDAFTIEPGIYISTRLLDMLPDTPKNREFIAKVRPVVEKYNNIGIRIEDDYFVVEHGVEWVSRAPREIVEIEALMHQGHTAEIAGGHWQLTHDSRNAAPGRKP